MQLTVNNFLALPKEQLYEITCLNFWDAEEETNEDLSLLSDEDFIKLCERLSCCDKLIRLELCDNNIGGLAQTRIVALTSKIVACDNLKILDLSNNNLHFLELESWVVLSNNLAKSSSLMAIILHDNQLGSLDYGRLSVILDNLAKINLKSLDLARNELGNNHALELLIDKIANYSALNSLDLSYNNLFEDFLQFNRLFYNLHQITALNLSNNKLGLITEIFSSDVSISYKIETLDISNNELGSSEQVFIFMMQQALGAKELNLCNNQLYLLVNKIEFSNFKHLEVLNLADNDFSKFTQQNIIELIASLSCFDRLRELDLAKTNLSDLSTADLHNLFDSLINNCQLISLNLAENKLGLTKITPKLSELLKQNKLINLDLSDNLLSCLADIDWQDLLTGLAASRNLKTLNISSNELQTLSKERIISLSQTLKNCSCLEKLDLGDQNFADTDLEKLQILFTALSELPNLRKLDISDTLSYCLDQEECMNVLSIFMNTTTSLKTLKLERNISRETEQQLNDIIKGKPWVKLKLR